MNKRNPLLVLFAGFLLGVFIPAGFLFGGTETPSKLTYISSPEIRINGNLEESVWSTIPPFKDWHQLAPNEGDTPSEKTEMRIFHDGNAIYLGARLFTRNISTLISRRLERDSYISDQDAVAVILDTLHDKRTAYGFIVTSAGVRTDIAIFDDAETGSTPWNTDWNAFWDAAARRDPCGWSVEIRIPFSSLRFKNQSGQAKMGMILWRYIAKNVEYSIFPAIPNNWSLSAYKPSQAMEVQIENIKEKHPFFLRPYAIGGLEQENILQPALSSYNLRSRHIKSIGLDLKYNLTSTLILDGTLNPDFAQVEADDQRINLTRFSLFFPEKRPFFQERSDLFDIRIPVGGQKLFHSRTIGIQDERPVPIMGGIRLTGRTGNWHIGLMEIQTNWAEIEGNRIPSENFGVLRIKREVKKDGSFFGGMVTSRTDFHGRINLVTAFDSDFSLSAPHAYIKLRLAHSYQPDSYFKKSLMGAITLESRIHRGFSYALVARHIGSRFNPGMGYLYRSNINLLYNRLGYTWLPGSPSPIQNHGFQNKMIGIWNNETGQFETFNNNLFWEGIFRSGEVLKINLRIMEENLLKSFYLGNVEILAGHYRFAYADANFISFSGSPFQMGFKGTVGGYYGGRILGSELFSSWTLSSHLALRLDYIVSTTKVRGKKYRPHVTRLRLNAALNRALSARALIQYSSDLRQISSNIRIRYNPSEGVDAFIVYNEGTYTSLDHSVPRLPRTQGRSVLIKFNYTFLF